MAVDRNEISIAKDINATEELSFLECHSSAILPVILIISDYVSVLLAEKTALFLRPLFSFAYNGSFNVPDSYQYIFVPAVFLFFLIQARTHNRRQPFWLLTKTIFQSVLYSVFVGVALLFFAHIADKVSRIFVMLIGPIAFVYISSMRYIINKILAKFNFLQEPVVVIGAGKTAELIVNFFEKDAGFNLEVLGLIDEKASSSALSGKYKIYESFAQTEKIIKATGVKSVVVAAPEMERDELLKLINSIQPSVKNISFVPDLLGIPAGSLEIEQLFDEKLLLIRTKNNLSRWYNRLYKRIFDIVLSSFSMVFFIPLGILIALCIYIDSPGTVVFSHKRVGQGGKYFPCYKFRTMVPKAEGVLAEYLSKNLAAKEEWDNSFKLKDDPRVTRVGKFLRKTSLDELPQIINVLKGEMSLVGPRPIVKDEIEKYGDYIRDYYLVFPGITGMWQVNGRSDTTYAERVAMDTWYVRNWSVWLDLVFLFKTVKIVLNRKGAY
ncbi:MAG: undecaprenyl-phosphate galactose phosphotransferase WbaP [Negativicutes bacterium]|nr:undecaprenyl-phosphate galactose phosphotransferase WbaP [Negativicutes bacterium]